MVYEFMPQPINGGPDAADGNMIIFNNTFVYAANDAGVGAELFAGEGVVGVNGPADTASPLQAWVDAARHLTSRLPGSTIEAAWLLDATGRRLREWTGGSTDRVTMPLHGVTTGVHILQVRAGDALYVRRVFIP